MTLALRREILGIIAREAHVSGIGCETLIDVHGRELYEPHGGREIRTVAFRGDRARVCTTTGGRASFAREHGRWRLAHADTGRC